jgi:hypothetical protein
MPTLQEEVIRVWETACSIVVRAAEASTQEVVAMWESGAALVKDAEDRAALAEREARERVSRVEVESTVALGSARREAEVSPRGLSFSRVSLQRCTRLKIRWRTTLGVCSMWRTMLSDGGKSLRGNVRKGSRSLPSCKPGVLNYAKP